MFQKTVVRKQFEIIMSRPSELLRYITDIFTKIDSRFEILSDFKFCEILKFSKNNGRGFDFRKF